ncbi:MAG TPA: Gfo/Idh/MocA family oxidoreductase [Chthonomonadales bacterium]|nr:Gfo/Idh/MocA family oxidoreductase [Chthonomonadales bacterium]
MSASAGSRGTGVSRRDFVARAVGAGAAVAAPWIVPARARGAVPPSERITAGVIGVGIMGRGILGYYLSEPAIRIIAVCEVDRVRRDAAMQSVQAAYGATSGCTAYNDYREMLARPDLDAVLIVTPDHWHALQAVHAAQAGKDVYCEKPISLTIAEGRRIVEAVRSHGCVFQTGTQYRSAPTIRRVCDFVRRGGLGKVRHAFCLWSRVEGGYIPVSHPLPAEPVPDGLDWNLWVGPAPWRPYNHRFHRNPMTEVVPWAFNDDFGAASVTWHNSHCADVIQYALGVEESGPVEIIHPSSGRYPTLTFRYAHGPLLHLVDDWGALKRQYGVVPEDARLEGSFGGVFVGERGWVTSMHARIEGHPPSIFDEMGLRNRGVPGPNNHHANWLECIRTRGRTSTGEEIGHRSASLGHLAHTAFRLGRTLSWDPATETFARDDAANRLRSRAMREPWRL